MPRSLALAVCLALTIGGCGGASDGTEDGSSGIRGVAHIGPQCPVVQSGSPCPDLPFDGEVRVSNPAGEQVATAPTEDDGSFEITLAPGPYIVDVVIADPGAPPFAKPVTVEVSAGAYAEVDLPVDSGIR